MKRLTAMVVTAAIAFPAMALAYDIRPERRALLISVIEGLGCRVDGVTPPAAFLEAMEQHKFVQEETKAIADQLVAEGLATREGPVLALKTGKCV